MTQSELDVILRLHKLWAQALPKGERADLSGADLTCLDLSNENLTGANLRGAVLRGADLRFTSMKGCDLRGAVLDGANLRGASFDRADMTGADLGELNVPVIPSIDATILAAILADPAKFDMAEWHTPCGTTHCQAGWTVVLAGAAGAELESRLGTQTAGGLIYAASRPGKPVPNFFATNNVALAAMRAGAAAKLEAR